MPESLRDLLEGPVTISLATLMADGTPQVQPVWCGYDGTHIWINTEKGRQKYRNLSRRRKATVLAVDPNNDNRWVEVRGAVVEETEAGAFEHIDELARLYLGLDDYPWNRDGDIRVIFKIAPERVNSMETTMPERESDD
ncbi:PPOX class F420-dependent oxidoreductase [Elongatibacter sediminis]|uniref:PPOX class F420-dependent oxidoreductase n=1 Tax=Elongatibacter sediminis TaxID=3119006 RepID=A0AAW9RKF0_9GAMM